jgi:uncharacterized protein (TIGR03083 family)
VTTQLPKAQVLDALTATYAVFEALLAELRPDDWTKPTPCPGWDVRAQVAHVIGTESMMEGIEAPVAVDAIERPAHVRNDIGMFNEQWIAGLAEASPEEMGNRLHAIIGTRLAAIEAMDDEGWAKESFTPAGPDSYGRFMRIRVMDTWMHEQDIRDAVGRPGHVEGPAVALALDEIQGAMGFVVGKKAGAPAGSRITFDVTGPGGRQIHVAVDERAAVVERLDRPADVVVRMPVHTFSRLAGGRSNGPDLRGTVELEGDEALGNRIVDDLGYMI